jgi:hypothetical protein
MLLSFILGFRGSGLRSGVGIRVRSKGQGLRSEVSRLEIGLRLLGLGLGLN